MFVRLSSKKVTNPISEVKALQRENAAATAAGEPPKYSPEELQKKIEQERFDAFCLGGDY